MLAGAQDADYCFVVKEHVIPEIHRFKPHVVFVAVGFDALKADPYADQELTVFWYGWCVAELMRLGIPLVLNLEGGYDPRASARAINECVSALAGREPAEFATCMDLGPPRSKYKEHIQRMIDIRLQNLQSPPDGQEPRNTRNARR